MKGIIRDDIAYDEVNEKIRYNPITGELFRIERIAGFNEKGGYRRICINGKSYVAQRLAWLLHHGEWPSGFVDHIDGNPSNNKISNLRIVSQSQNCMNTKIGSANTSGHKGVYWDKRYKKWRAQIGFNSKKIWLGWFDNIEDAIKARKIAESKFHGEFSRKD